MVGPDLNDSSRPQSPDGAVEVGLSRCAEQRTRRRLVEIGCKRVEHRIGLERGEDLFNIFETEAVWNRQVLKWCDNDDIRGSCGLDAGCNIGCRAKTVAPGVLQCRRPAEQVVERWLLAIG